MTRPSGLRGTVAVVTGGGSGIGRAAALSFARRGARVAVTDLSGARTEAVAGEVEAFGSTAIGLRSMSATKPSWRPRATSASLAGAGSMWS